jgi:two-component system, LytTR family, sensor kinase
MDIKLIKFYLWMGLIMISIGVIDLVGSYPGRVHIVIFNNLWFAIYITVINYLLFEYSIPFVTRKRKKLLINILLAVILLATHSILYSFGLYIWRFLGIQLGVFNILRERSTLYGILEDLMVYSMGSFFIFGIARHIYTYVKLKQDAQKLKIEKQEAELNYLKSQTNPHFLFNTLNNIYSLTRDKSDRAPESVMRLSKILRYMLYDAGVEYISLEKEIKIISDYIELEKLRYDETLRVNFSYNIEDIKQDVPPLLMIPLVENAFKHGVSETRSQPFVDIYIQVKNRILELIVKNSTEPVYEVKKVKENIGLSNLRRQLELLYKEYQLNVDHRESEFIAFLRINLASHV